MIVVFFILGLRLLSWASRVFGCSWFGVVYSKVVSSVGASALDILLAIH